MINIELTRFRVIKGKSEKVNEWMKFLNDNMKDVLLTLEGEKMYVETIFREILDGEEYLYWYSVQGKGGIEGPGYCSRSGCSHSASMAVWLGPPR